MKTDMKLKQELQRYKGALDTLADLKKEYESNFLRLLGNVTETELKLYNHISKEFVQGETLIREQLEKIQQQELTVGGEIKEIGKKSIKKQQQSREAKLNFFNKLFLKLRIVKKTKLPGAILKTG